MGPGSRRRSYEIPLPTGEVLRLGERTLVMATLNVTPDSFSDGGRFADPSAAVDAGLAMAAAGADIIDVGGESTRPRAEAVSTEEELHRVLPVLAGLARQTAIPLSIDTMKADVARAALDKGASIVNDVSGLQHDQEMAGAVANGRAALVLMHMRGSPREMYQQARYDDVIGEIAEELGAGIRRAVDAGVPLEAIIIDPGLGFAKLAEHSLDVLSRLDAATLTALDRPLLVGPSRKSFLGAVIGSGPAPERDWATAAAVTAAILFGAHVVRVHRVQEMVQVARVADALLEHRAQGPRPKA